MTSETSGPIIEQNVSQEEVSSEEMTSGEIGSERDGENSTGRAARTGDEKNMLLYGLIAAVSAAALFYDKRRRKSA